MMWHNSKIKHHLLPHVHVIQLTRIDLHLKGVMSEISGVNLNKRVCMLKLKASSFVGRRWCFILLLCHIISYCIMYHIVSCIILYHVSYCITYHIVSRIILYHVSYCITYHIVSHIILCIFYLYFVSYHFMLYIW
jgi:hypothetical protein